jgi:streptogramin lyase
MRSYFSGTGRPGWRSWHRFGATSRRSRRPIARVQVESLESRFLPAVTITAFPVPTTGANVIGTTAGPDGNIWFTELLGNNIGELNPATGDVTEFPIPKLYSEPQGITVGPNGNLWFTELAGPIGEINATTHVMTEFPLPSDSGPYGITAAPDGNLWFTESRAESDEPGNAIGEINPTTGAITEFPIPSALSQPLSITAGPDGNLWFTEHFTDKIGELNPTTGAISEFPTPTEGSEPFGITAGADGNLWFTEENGNKIGEINATTDVITEFSIPTAASDPLGITSAPDGNLWFVEWQGDKIGEINPTTDVITEYPVPTADDGPQQIAAAPNGSLWFGAPDSVCEVQVGAVVGTAAAKEHLQSSANPSIVGQHVTITATVAAVTGNETPTGTVTFIIDGQAETPSTLSVVDGVDEATFSTTTLAAGPHTISAAYSGDTVFAAGNVATPLTQKVDEATTIQIASSADPSTIGQSVTFTADVTSAATSASLPTGAVTFIIDGQPEPPTTLTVEGGMDQAAFTTATLAPGFHTIGATYSGDAAFAASTLASGVTQQVTTVAPTPTPTRTVIVGEHPIFTRKLKKGKPVGKSILSGFTLDFDVALNPTSAANAATYDVGTFTTTKIKKKPIQRTSRAVTNFVVKYLAATDSVEIAFEADETFPTGGELTVLSGLVTATEATLTGPAVFTIAKGGKSLSPSS